MAVFATGQTILAENVDFETYLREYEGQKVEYDDGKVIELSPTTGRHNEIVGFLYVLLATYVQKTGEGKARQERFTMKLTVEGKIRGPEPDLFVVTTANLHNLADTYMEGAADLVVEVVSADSDLRDRVTKLALYQAAGVREYWIIDPIFEECLFYVIGETGEYQRQPLDEQGFYQSTVLPRFRFNPSLVLQNPVPDLEVAFETVREMLTGR